MALLGTSNIEYADAIDVDRRRVIRVVEEAQRRVEEAARRLRHEALSYRCMRPEATSVRGLKLLVYEALSY